MAKLSKKTTSRTASSLPFVPAPLPPHITWTDQLVRSLSDADRLVGALAGHGAQLPNPHVLIRPFIRREAVLSSKIEGTQATIGELLAAEAGVNVDRSADDLREVGNYVAALEYGVKRLQKLPLSLRLIGELHAKLMKGVRGDHAAPGEFRRVQNWIGPPGCTEKNATYVPPPPGRLMGCLSDLESYFQNNDLPILIQVALVHYQFEAIHPFLDGNGRVGRLLITLMLMDRRVLPEPLLYLSAFFEATRQDYYGRLLDVSRNGKWDDWIVYFLNGVARQAEDGLSRAARINELLAKWRRESAGKVTNNAMMLIEIASENPFLTIKGVAKRLDVAYTTAQRAVLVLQDIGILDETSNGKRDRVFCATKILEILEEPARLIPDRAAH
ncbi:MAG: Fic family protein [Phycisphaerales bacterium]|nr:Fic family protein [Phycisphaerales bacterium]MCB9856963.1 Fic family protein [Phycisphaerales bacterium]MCB9861910.1 Fic family protein [Phycisphaerales bacterium]